MRPGWASRQAGLTCSCRPGSRGRPRALTPACDTPPAAHASPTVRASAPTPRARQLETSQGQSAGSPSELPLHPDAPQRAQRCERWTRVRSLSWGLEGWARLRRRSDVPALLPLSLGLTSPWQAQAAGVTVSTEGSRTAALPQGPSAAPRWACRGPVLSALGVCTC